jgi:hypothetical protein
MTQTNNIKPSIVQREEEQHHHSHQSFSHHDEESIEGASVLTSRFDLSMNKESISPCHRSYIKSFPTTSGNTFYLIKLHSLLQMLGSLILICIFVCSVSGFTTLSLEKTGSGIQMTQDSSIFPSCVTSPQNLDTTPKIVDEVLP